MFDTVQTLHHRAIFNHFNSLLILPSSVFSLNFNSTLSLQGAGYWDYASRYTVFAITSLKTAMGTDYGLGNFTGFGKTAEFAIQHTAPSLQIFNWADSHYSPEKTAAPADTGEMFYLSTEYKWPGAAFFERFKIEHGAHSSAEDVISFSPNGTTADLEQLPKCQLYPVRNVLVARSSWIDPMATWVGFKGGSVAYTHSHMDLGSFVFEAKGYRWAIDLGADSYALPEYFGKLRFTYYRLRNIGHNTLTFDDDNMGSKSTSELHSVTCSDDGNVAQATADLTNAYEPSQVKSVSRQLTLQYLTKTLSIVDNIDLGESKAKEISWAMHTYANITIDASGTSATLTQGTETVSVAIDAHLSKCPGLKMSSLEIDLKPPQNPSTGIRKLLLQAEASTCTCISVLLHY